MRFKFGQNWSKYLEHINEERIENAIGSLKEALGASRLDGKRFLDIGSGSGLFSLAARKLGATVVSFDYDSDSVSCTKALKSKYLHDDTNWSIEQGSVLDEDYLNTLGKFDIVYSWGVLHHTGDMELALQNAIIPLAESGKLFIAIYNDQGAMSDVWTGIKKLYNRSGSILRFFIVLSVGVVTEGGAAIVRLFTLRNPLPFKSWKERRSQRGMSIWHDLVDWVGGYPFEVATPEKIFSFYRSRGFTLEFLITRKGGMGCCEYVFSRLSRN